MLRIAMNIMPLKWICTVYMLLHMKKIGLPAAFVPTRLSLVDFFVVTCGSGLDTNGQNSETWIKQEVENLNTICTFGLFWRWSQLGNCITEDGRTGRHYFSCLRSIREWNNNNCNRLWDYAWCKRITRYCVLHLYPTLIILLLKTGESCFFFDWGRPDLTSAKKWDKKAEVVKTFVIRRLRCYHINYLQSWW